MAMSMTTTNTTTTQYSDCSEPSLCIPRVFTNITRETVISVIEDYGLGLVERVDMVLRENEQGKPFNRVFIHFKQWNDTEKAQDARDKIMSGEMIHVTYDKQWYWKIGKNFSKKVLKTKTTNTTKKNDGPVQKLPTAPKTPEKRVQFVNGVAPFMTPPPRITRINYPPLAPRKLDLRPVKRTNTVEQTDIIKELRELRAIVEEQGKTISKLTTMLTKQQGEATEEATEEATDLTPPPLVRGSMCYKAPEQIKAMFDDHKSWFDICESESV